MVSLPRTLLVDDSPVVRRALARRLAASGVSTLEASSAAEAEALVEPFDAVVMDLELGAIDGAEVALSLRGRNPALRVAFFTSGSTAEVLRRASEIGPVFAKPDDLDALAAWVKSGT